MEGENNRLRVLIITGLSGAGKSLTVNCLEDMGYYCVDNLPPALMSTFIDLSMQSERKFNTVALVIDVRGGAFFKDLSRALQELQEKNINFEVLFLEASDEVLIRRYKESRRMHPLASEGQLLEAIQAERRLLEEIRGKANVVIDTSSLNARELKNKIINLFGGENGAGQIRINVVSFGYKAGIPLDSDIIMDVRFLPNPFYDARMKTMTGRDREVIDYVLNSPVTRAFNEKFTALLEFLIPHYINEGKSNLQIAIGCTGGQHRSVVLAEYIGEKLAAMGYKTVVKHRDLPKYEQED